MSLPICRSSEYYFKFAWLKLSLSYFGILEKTNKEQPRKLSNLCQRTISEENCLNSSALIWFFPWFQRAEIGSYSSNFLNTDNIYSPIHHEVHGPLMKEGKTIDNYPLDSRSVFKSSQILRQGLRNVTKINDLRKTGSVALLFLAP